MDNFQQKSYDCGICFQKYTKQFRAPISLNCGHTFCRRCVRHLDRGVAHIVCGTCRSKTYAKSTNMGKNVVLIDLLETFELLSLTDDEEKAEDERETRAYIANKQQDRQIGFDNTDFGGWNDYVNNDGSRSRALPPREHINQQSQAERDLQRLLAPVLSYMDGETSSRTLTQVQNMRDTPQSSQAGPSRPISSRAWRGSR